MGRTERDRRYVGLSVAMCGVVWQGRVGCCTMELPELPDGVGEGEEKHSLRPNGVSVAAPRPVPRRQLQNGGMLCSGAQERGGEARELRERLDHNVHEAVGLAARVVEPPADPLTRCKRQAVLIRRDLVIELCLLYRKIAQRRIFRLCSARLILFYPPGSQTPALHLSQELGPSTNATLSRLRACIRLASVRESFPLAPRKQTVLPSGAMRHGRGQVRTFLRLQRIRATSRCW